MIKYFIGFVIACVLWVIVLYNTDMPEYKIYDCSMAEWHPDIPIDVKEECRKRKQTDQKRNNEITI